MNYPKDKKQTWYRPLVSDSFLNMLAVNLMCGLCAFILYPAILYSIGNNWEVTLAFNDRGEGLTELIMLSILTPFFIWRTIKMAKKFNKEGD